MNTYKIAREVGFKNINVDLMLGLPGQSLEDIEDTLKEVINLNANHISVYSLILEEGTFLESEVSSGNVQMIDEDLERKMYWKVKEILENARLQALRNFKFCQTSVLSQNII